MAGMAGLLLAGCRIPVQERPASTLTVPAAWRAPLQVGPNARVEGEWWRAFGDPALDALVAQALAHNGDLRAAGARLQEYQARIRVAQSAALPSLSIAIGPSRGRAIGPFGAP